MSTPSLHLSAADFGSVLSQLITPRALGRLAAKHRSSSAGAPPKLPVFGLIAGMVFHVLQTCGLLSAHLRQVCGKRLSDSAISERRQTLGSSLFQCLLDQILVGFADASLHPRAFYKGLRLVGIDGTCWNVSNTPPVKACVTKNRSRRFQWAFYKLSMVAIYELGTHNPLAARIGMNGESEMNLAIPMLTRLRQDWLLIADRLYGVAKFIATLQMLPNSPPFLLRARCNLKSKVLQKLPDGSCLVEVYNRATGKRLYFREIHARIRRRSGGWSSIRLWTSLLDPALYPAAELVELYGMRWEQECAFKELKIHLRRSSFLLSHTLVTAAQEVACLVLAQAIIARARITVAADNKPVLQISFIRTLALFRSFWAIAPVIGDLLDAHDITLVMTRLMDFLAQQSSPPRRNRSCPRAVRQPVSGWPRLIRNSYESGTFQFAVIPS
jgi:hypothetical protein